MDITGNAFVTGGGSGIGKAVCLALAKEGASGIFIVDMNPKAAEATVVEITSVASNPRFRAEVFPADITVEDSVKTAVARMVQSFGRIDYCVHCAGIIEDKFVPVDEISFPDFQATVSSQVYGTFLVIGQTSAVMKAQELKLKDSAHPQLGGSRGSIVVLGSILSHLVSRSMGAYAASKHAVLGIAKTAAIENASFGIRVNCICPTWVDTPMFYRVLEGMPGLDPQGVSNGMPMNRICTPQEVADTILFLCSPRSSYITGIALGIDGGHPLTLFYSSDGRAINLEQHVA
ncbi:NAD(P)-binding protein [Rostrohypoxylon terebratum]|nr:NAD(P)-binding protein [Rostrohypoxylon terebratum]